MTTSFRNITSDFTDSAISIRESENVTFARLVARPFRMFLDRTDANKLKASFIRLVNACSNAEMSFRSSSSDVGLRKALLGYPNMPKISYIGNEYTMNNGNLVKKETAQISIAFIVFFATTILSYCEEVRRIHTERFSQLANTPRFLAENFLRVRESNCGSYRITPKLDTVILDELLSVVPELENTYLDYRFLTKPEGIDSFLTMLKSIHESNPDYLKFVSTLKLKNLPFYSTFQTTQCSIFSDPEDSNKISVLQHNSFKDGSPTNVHVYDAAIINQQFEINSKPLIAQPKHLVLTNLDTDTCAKYIIDRMLGVINNSLEIEDFAKTSSPGKKPTSTKKSKVISKGIDKDIVQHQILKMCSSKDYSFLAKLFDQFIEFLKTRDFSDERTRTIASPVMAH